MSSPHAFDRDDVPVAARPPYAWTAEETSRVLSGYLDGVSIRELSMTFGRSAHHVVQHLAWHLLGVSPSDVNALAPRFREPWSDTELLVLASWHHRGVSVTETARRLERDPTEVAERLLLGRLVVASSPRQRPTPVAE